MKVKDRYEVRIIDVDNIGNGICRVDNRVIFVKSALLDEELEIEITNIGKNYCAAKIVRVINANKDRINVICPYYDNCGGCDFLHTNYFNERKIKHEYLEKLFNTSVYYINTSNVLNYRNKVTLHVIDGKLGYYNNKTHDLCEIVSCYLLNPKINLKIGQLSKMNLSNISEIMIRCINNKIMINIKGDISDFNIDCDSLYINNKYVRGEKYLVDVINNHKYSIYPESFYQVNKEGMINIYNEAYKSIPDGQELLDLYCGIGSIGIWMNNKFKSITGIELNESSINNANINKELNELNNVKFICKDAAEVKGNFDTIIVDPPRNGLSKKVIKYLNNSKSSRIVYISCNPNTLKRDIDLLTNYKLLSISCCDMFPRTKHVETVTVLERR